tara:strand:+ start:1414 stop:2976 length:1563 start_codon:yes stop_codon:yes gene_type:complete
MKILLSFVGNHDEVKLEGATQKAGPVLNIFENLQPDLVYLFFNVNPSEQVAQFQRIARENKELIENKHPDARFEYRRIEVSDPTDVNVLYPLITDKVKEIIDEHGYDENEYYAGISSGTPAMYMIWFLLQQGGVLNATLLQSLEPRHQELHGGKKYLEVNLDLDDFPEIEVPKELKRKTTIFKRQKEQLESQVQYQEKERDFPDIIGNSEAIMDLKDRIREDIDNNTHVLILGERGTGKRVVANSIWTRYHLDTDDSLVRVDMGTLSPSLIESELFGHKRGSFTGATEDKQGILGINKDRMIFLDEIGNLSLEGQAKLLSFLESGEFQRIGDPRTIVNPNVQVIAATNADVQDERKFRSDLRDRFDEIIVIPPLVERMADIPLLVKHFLNKQDTENPVIFSEEVVNKLREHNWPGNIRELEQWVSRVVRRFRDTGGEISLRDLPDRYVEDILNDSSVDIYIPPLPLDIDLDTFQLQMKDAILKKARNQARRKVDVDRLLGQNEGVEKQRRYRERLEQDKS